MNHDTRPEAARLLPRMIEQTHAAERVLADRARARGEGLRGLLNVLDQHDGDLDAALRELDRKD